MKIIHYLTVLLLAGFLHISCTDNDRVDPVDGPKPPVEKPDSSEYVTPIGTAQGALISKMIGPAGGTLSNPDGRFTIQIPAGALKAEQNISIQPITNTNSSGKGAAYRLLPHGIMFSKPVKLTLKYTEQDIQTSIPEAFGIAYQSDKNIWMSVGGVKTDTAAKTVSVNTTHFSDWSFFEAITVESVVNVISPGEKVKFAVHYALNPEDDLDPLSPLGREGLETILLQSKKLIDPKYIDGWEGVQEGTLKNAKNSAEYQSPGKIPNKNPVEVIVRIKLKNNKLGFIISKLYVAPPGISVQINNTEWRTIPGAIAEGTDGVFLIAGSSGDESVVIKWKDSLFGVYPWKLETVACLYQAQKLNIYQHIYGKNSVNISRGFLTTEQSRDINNQSLLVGSFDVKSAGHYDTRNPKNPLLTTEKMHGVFRVK